MPEKLDWITIEKKYVKPLKEEDKPYYTLEDKKILAWSIAFEGTLDITKATKTNLFYTVT